MTLNELQTLLSRRQEVNEKSRGLRSEQKEEAAGDALTDQSGRLCFEPS